jgi:hypothetical protein
MKRLILDYFRRWWWMFALGSVLLVRLGWSIAKNPDDRFEFWLFLIAMWMGAILLGSDLKKGAARAVLTLPLTARQIGRGWWLATIVVPAAGMSACMFSGAEIFHCVHPEKVLPMPTLWMASFFVLPWLATAFTSVYGMNNDVISGNWRQRLAIMFFSWLAIITLFGGMLTLQDSTRAPVKFAIYQVAAVVMIVAGWIRAERFVVGRASFRMPSIRYRNPLGQYRAPAGYGGIALLFNISFLRIFLYVAAMVGLMALLMFWREGNSPANLKITVFAGMSSLMSCGFVIVFQVLPVLRQFRLLRTLPVSATRLALVIMAIAILPLILLGGLVTVIAWLALGGQAAGIFLSDYTFVLAPVSFCVFFAAWLGESVMGYVLLAVTIFGMQQVQLGLQTFLHLHQLPMSIVGAIALGGALLAFVLTRHALLHGGRSYRVWALPSGNFT